MPRPDLLRHAQRGDTAAAWTLLRHAQRRNHRVTTCAAIACLHRFATDLNHPSAATHSAHPHALRGVHIRILASYARHVADLASIRKVLANGLSDEGVHVTAQILAMGHQAPLMYPGVHSLDAAAAQVASLAACKLACVAAPATLWAIHDLLRLATDAEIDAALSLVIDIWSTPSLERDLATLALSFEGRAHATVRATWRRCRGVRALDENFLYALRAADWSRRNATVAQLATSCDTRVWPVIAEALRDRHPNVQHTALRALAFLGDPRPADLLLTHYWESLSTLQRKQLHDHYEWALMALGTPRKILNEASINGSRDT